MNREKMKTVLLYAAFFLILGVHIVSWTMYCSHTGLAGDEYFSYGLANGTEDYIFWDMNQIEAHSNEGGWIEGSSIWSYLVVDEGEQFSFDRVWWNQEHDVHPPLYYLVLNSICSFFPNQFSIWFGKGLNIFFLALLEFVMFRLSMLFLGKKFSALVPGAVWGATGAAFSLATLVRMYAMLAFFCLLLVYVHTRLYLNGFRKKDYVWLGAAVTLGGLTHYYFYVFLVLYGGLFFLLMLWEKREKRVIFTYCGSIIAGGIAALLIFPKTLYHIFGGYRGGDVKGKLFSFDFNFSGFMEHINENVFNGKGWLFVGGAVVCLLLAMAVKRWKKEKTVFTMTPGRWMWLVGALSGVLYAAVMMKISISVRSHYISPCYAVLGCFLSLAVIRVLACLGERWRFVLLALLCGVFFVRFVPEKIRDVESWYAETASFLTRFEQYRDKDCIFVYNVWDNLFTNQINILALEDEIYCVDQADLETDDYPENLEKRRSEDELVIILPNDDNEEERVQVIARRLGMKADWALSGGFSVYLLTAVEEEP